jgi:hypothetical protein
LWGVKPYERETVARQALKHVHVFSIQSTTQKMSVLDNLADYLLGNHAREIVEDVPVAAALPKHRSSPRQLSLIVLDWRQHFIGLTDSMQKLHGLKNSPSHRVATKRQQNQHRRWFFPNSRNYRSSSVLW